MIFKNEQDVEIIHNGFLSNVDFIYYSCYANLIHVKGDFVYSVAREHSVLSSGNTFYNNILQTAN